MDLRDFLVAPFVAILIYVVAYIFRPYVTDEINRKYFMWALTVRMLGAVALGLIYQFYYHGGDTYNFHTWGSRWIWQAFFDDPEKGIQLLMSDGTHQKETFKYTVNMFVFPERSSMVIIKMAAILDLFTFSSYVGTSLFFAAISFVGSWCLFLTFYSRRNDWHKQLAIITLFIPSVVFWGSGLLKDTVTLAGVSIATFLIKTIFIDRRFSLGKMLILIFVLYVTLRIKMYILLCFVPAAICWVLTSRIKNIRSQAVKVLVLPIGLVFTLLFGYSSILLLGMQDQRYQLATIAQTARVTAYDIAFQTGRDAGSNYSLGELDGTLGGMIKLAPGAINVSLFRPYIWEVRNPLMLMSALESLFLLLVFCWVLLKAKRHFSLVFSDSSVIFCLMFSVTFAFAVGVSTFNFGTLSRYKIPLIPFFLLAMLIIYQRAKSEKKVSQLDLMEYP